MCACVVCVCVCVRVRVCVCEGKGRRGEVLHVPSAMYKTRNLISVMSRDRLVGYIVCTCGQVAHAMFAVPQVFFYG